MVVRDGFEEKTPHGNNYELQDIVRFILGIMDMACPVTYVIGHSKDACIDVGCVGHCVLPNTKEWVSVQKGS